MNTEWIPIEKELPEVAKAVFVTVSCDFRWVSFVRRCSNGTWNYVDSGAPIESDFKIIAWMKVPNPYMGDIK